jgi:exosortase H (IPTLxxWG-CTERM-specific)
MGSPDRGGLRFGGWFQRPETRFLLLFFAILGATFFVVALRPVNDGAVLRYTELVARTAAGALSLLGEDATVTLTRQGPELCTPRFAVIIHNGCNGLITSLVFVSGVLAFPARPRAKLIGLGVGVAAIQLVNQVRIVSLYYTGVLLPRFFNQSHIFVWQSIVILSGVALWLLWARRCGDIERDSS